MMICPQCGKQNPDDAEFCQYCNASLIESGKPPRLLSQIQGLIPAEPIITSGRLRNDRRISPSVLPATLPPAAEEDKSASDVPRASRTLPPKKLRPKPKGEPPQPRFTPPPPRLSPRANRKSSALITIAIIFLGVIVLGSFSNFLAPQTPPISPAVKNTYAFIEILPPSSQVLLAWDYDPATQGELELLAQPILQHLQRRGINIVSMSLKPFGPDVAADAYDLSSRLGAGYMAIPSSRPVDLGFLPGETAALHALASSPVLAASQPVHIARATGLRSKDTVDAFDLIIEFSSDFASTQQWVEQVNTKSQSPLIVAASGAISPLLLPYEQTGQIKILLSGYPDALAYEQMLGQKGPAHQQASAQTLSLLAFLGLIFIAAFRSLLSPHRR